jgi:hypothetical protein
MLTADFIAKWRPADPCLMANGLGLLLDRELTAPGERRLRYARLPVNLV